MSDPICEVCGMEMKYHRQVCTTSGSLAAPAGAAWIHVTDQAPPRDVVVETKIHDWRGVRNQTTLKLHGNLWFFPDMSMYVYYSPTHWRMPNEKGQP